MRAAGNRFSWSLLVVLDDVSGGDGLIVSARFTLRLLREGALHSAIWEVIADTLYWIQLGWVLSGFALMAYLALRVFPWRDETRRLPPTARVLGWKTNLDPPIARTGGRMIVAGSYRFDWNYSQLPEQEDGHSRGEHDNFLSGPP